MSEEPRDKWSRFDIMSKAIAGLLLPLVIFYFTYQQQKSNEARLKQEKANEGNRLEQQRQADLVQRNADRTTNLLGHLASDNKRERLLAIKLIGYFIGQKQLPGELGPVLIETFETDEDPDVRSAAEALITQRKSELQPAIYSEAQVRLKDLKYYEGEITGIADEATIDAVLRFQKEHGLMPDGAVGPRTLAELRRAQERPR